MTPPGFILLSNFYIFGYILKNSSAVYVSCAGALAAGQEIPASIRSTTLLQFHSNGFNFDMLYMCGQTSKYPNIPLYDDSICDQNKKLEI